MRSCIFAMIAWVMALLSVSAIATPRDTDPVAYLDNALDLLRARHINRADADWSSIEAAARAQIRNAKTTSDTYPAIRTVLAALGEKHSFLIELHRPTASGSTAGKQVGVTPPSRIPLPTGIPIRGHVGAIWLPSMNSLGDGGQAAATAYTEALRSALQALDGKAKCGWFVDLRQNGGGNMWPMLNGLDPLLGDAPFGHFVAGKSEPQPWVRTADGIAPSSNAASGMKLSFALKHGNAPVAILIGPQTSSSGEMVAIALLGRPNVRTFGTPSAGFSTANETHPLSDGATLAITVMTVRDRTGKDYRGPIVPDEEAKGQAAEIAAVEWLESRCAQAE